jgi:hypothetical protein
VTGFPDEFLELTPEAAFGADLTADPSTWTWTDLSLLPTGEKRLLDTPITIRRGVAVGASQAQTTSATVNLRNDDGALTPNLATSAYWPYVDSGTPMRLRLRSRTSPYTADTFTRTVSNGWGTADTGEAWTVVSTPSAFSTNGSVAQISISATNTARQIRTSVNPRDVDMVFDVAVNAVATGVGHSIGPMLRVSGGSLWRLWPTVEFGLSGAVAVRVRQYFNSTSSTTLANVTVPALTYAAGTMIRCRVQARGDNVKMRAWLASGAEPTTWLVDVTTTITGRNAALVPGADLPGIQATVFTGNTNTLPVVFSVDNVTISQPRYDRVEGYITDVRPVFLPQPDGSTWSTVQIDIGGIGSRLEKQDSPSYSPMRRSVQLATQTPIGYWPCEDEEGSTYAVSAFPGGPKMIVTGPAVFAFSQGTPVEQYLSRYGTKPIVSLAAGARLTAPVPLSAVQTEWAVTFVGEFFEPDVPSLTEMRILQWDTPSSALNRWALVATDTGYQVRAYNDSAGTSTNVATYATVFTGQVTYTVEANQNGGNVDIGLFFNDNLLASGSIAGTLAAVSKVSANPDQTNTTGSLTPAGIKFVVGHIRVVDETSVHDTPFYVVPETGQVVTAIHAWYLEPAHRRVERLCDEERVPIELLGDPGTTGMTILNAQQDGSFTDLTKSAVESESGGVLIESGFGYRYLPRSARYNQAVKLTVDLATYRRSEDTDPADVLVPQLESRAANYWTVTRHLGAEGSYAADQAFRARRGTIRAEAELDVLQDADTDAHAQWRTHVNVDARDAFYPALPIDLAANPDLIEDWLWCDIGSRVQRTNQPTVAGIGTIDQVIDGYAETLAPDLWLVAANGSPASVWDVGVYDDPGTLYSPSSTTLSSGITSSALSLTMAGEPWITGAVSLLFEIDGEQIAVSNISGSGNGPYTVTISARSVNGVVASHLAGAAVNLANPSRYAL